MPLQWFAPIAVWAAARHHRTASAAWRSARFSRLRAFAFPLHAKSTGWRALLQSQPGCQTTQSNHLRQVGSSAACFSTPSTLLGFSRRLTPPI